MKKAFTLAEILITLGIIGVVAAMTMPTLINNIKYHSYDNAKRKVLNSIGEAGKLLAIEGDLNGAADAEDFVKNRLAKKILPLQVGKILSPLWGRKRLLTNVSEC